MSDCPIVRYEDIESTPAEDLLKLRYCELNDLIREAERRSHRANLVLHWLRGLKVEKSLRYGGADES